MPMHRWAWRRTDRCALFFSADGGGILERGLIVKNPAAVAIASTGSIAHSHPTYALLFGGIRMQRLNVMLSLRSVDTEQSLCP
jgi:hypothetical protein